MKVLFWGVGAYADYVFQKIMRDTDVYRDEYIAYVDNNPKLWGESYHYKKVISPEEIRQYDWDIIVLAVNYDKYVKQIFKQINEDIGILETKLYSFGEYTQMCFARHAYFKQYGQDAMEGERKVFDLSHTVVYTAIIGDYDDLKEPLVLDKSITYICFTNNHNLKSNIWNIEYIDDDKMSNVMLARKIKIMPHLYLPEYSTSVWVDGSLQLRGDIKEYIKKYGKTQPVLCFPHCARLCLYSEGCECILARRGDKKEILGQISRYFQKGFPIDFGLYETGCIVRNHNDSVCIKLMQEWLEQLTIFSVRDQISLPYVCWNNEFKPDICDLPVYRNQWLRFIPHKKQCNRGRE